MTPYQLINPANPGSPIFIANQVARENAKREAATASTTAADVEPGSAGDIEMLCVFGFMAAVCILGALFFTYMAIKTAKSDPK